MPDEFPATACKWTTIFQWLMLDVHVPVVPSRQPKFVEAGRAEQARGSNYRLSRGSVNPSRYFMLPFTHSVDKIQQKYKLVNIVHAYGIAAIWGWAHNAFKVFGFNWVDLIIVILLLMAAFGGTRIGVLTQVFAIAGFFISLFVAGWLFPHLIPLHNSTLHTIINAVLVLMVATLAAARGFELGQEIHWSFRLGKHVDKRKLKAVEKWLGSLPAFLACLILVWLLGVAISRLPFAGFSNSVSDSMVFRTVADILPPAPAVFAGFDRQIDPNSQPLVTSAPKPYKGFNYSVDDVNAAEAKASKSLVRITSFGCGGLVSGSGFAVSSNLIATNAHVIAGVKRPIIKYNGESFEGIPVFFDPGLDIAIMQVQKLHATPLALESKPIVDGASVAVLGYPGGNYSSSPGIVRDSLSVASRNIYGEGTFDRDAYGIQTTVADGSSGGPAVLKDGRVIGMIFSKSTASNDYAYALGSNYLIASLKRLGPSPRTVSTGVCTAQ